MIQRQLSKAQGHTIQVLAMEREQLLGQMNEAQAAISDQAELLRKRYDLPEGEAQFTQGPDGWLIAVKPAPKPEAEAEAKAKAEAIKDAPEPGSKMGVEELEAEPEA